MEKIIKNFKTFFTESNQNKQIDTSYDVKFDYSESTNFEKIMDIISKYNPDNSDMKKQLKFFKKLSNFLKNCDYELIPLKNYKNANHKPLYKLIIKSGDKTENDFYTEFKNLKIEHYYNDNLIFFDDNYENLINCGFFITKLPELPNSLNAFLNPDEYHKYI
jgi:hypothetical protein